MSGWSSDVCSSDLHAFQATERFVMAVQYLAAHRFGLGRRFDDPAIEDPQDWLIRQLADYDPAPDANAGLAGREEVATAYAAYRDGIGRAVWRESVWQYV